MFSVPALDCPQELRLIEQGLSRLRGIVSLSPDYVRRTLVIEYVGDAVAAEKIAARLHDIGFPARLLRSGSENPSTAKGLWPAWNLWAGGGLLLAASACFWLKPGPLWLASALAGLAALVAGWRVMLGARRAFLLGRIDMNALMFIAACGAVATGDPFEAATAMLLFGIALWLEQWTLGKTSDALGSLLNLAPRIAHKRMRNAWTDVAVQELHIGDTVLVRPGERLPVDGRVTAGESSLNEAPITGESVPQEKKVGDDVFAGSLNGEGSLELFVLRSAEESTLAHVGRLVAEAQSKKSPSERSVDRFARWYTPAVILLAVAIAVGPPVAAIFGSSLFANANGWSALHSGLVLLVIACPCALVLSTPITITCGLQQAARQGLLVKGGEYLELAGRLRSMAFDKTGTLTLGRPKVTKIVAIPPATEEDVLACAASLEDHSEHPFALAIVKAAREKGLPLESVVDFVSLSGFGVSGSLAGEACVVARPQWFSHAGETLGSSPLLPSNSSLPNMTAIVVRAGTLWGGIELADELRPDAKQAIGRLRQLGLQTIVMLTGDRAEVANEIARRAGIDVVHAGLLPSQKVDEVHKLAASFPILAMVGDGLNDAPALAAAQLGIAFGHGASDTALETANVVVLSGHVSRIPDLVELGYRVRRILWQNILVSIGLKLVVLALAAFGMANMAAAVAADVGTSLLVIFNALRLLYTTQPASPPAPSPQALPKK